MDVSGGGGYNLDKNRVHIGEMLLLFSIFYIDILLPNEHLLYRRVYHKIQKTKQRNCAFTVIKEEEENEEI